MLPAAVLAPAGLGAAALAGQGSRAGHERAPHKLERAAGLLQPQMAWRLPCAAAR